MAIVAALELGGRPVDSARLVEICERYGISELAVFGSIARGSEHADSDVDVLFDLAPGVRLGFGVSALQHELEELFGRPVDLLSKDSIHRLVRDAVLEEAQVLYAA
jgi:predicted nucleotidyltransferase